MTIPQALQDLRSYFKDDAGTVSVSFNGRSYDVTWYRSRDASVVGEHNRISARNTTSIEMAVREIKCKAHLLRYQDLFTWALG